MTVDEVIDGLIRQEDGYQEQPADRGNLGGRGATNFGITSTTLGEWRRLGRPATKDEVKALTEDEARLIYRARYVRPFERIPFDELKACLVDFGVNSGPATAIKKLQEVLSVTVDGVLGPRTHAAVLAMSWKLTTNALIAARVKLVSDLADRDATQRQYLRGWVKRAVSFYVGAV